MKVIPFQKQETQTCKDCLFYDASSYECGVYDNVDTEDPEVFAACSIKEEFQPFSQRSETDYDEEDQEALYQQLIKNDGQNKYPSKPDVPNSRNDATWFVAPDNSFGCWIINRSGNPIVDGSRIPEEPETQRSYYTPFPLHNHNAMGQLASMMCWFVDEQGFGRYVIMTEDDVIPIH